MALTEQICRRSDGQPLTLLGVLTVENIRYTSGGADCHAPDTSHLFSVLPFPLKCRLLNLHLQWVLSAACLSSSSRTYFSGN